MRGFLILIFHVLLLPKTTLALSSVVCLGDSVTYANNYVSPGEGYCELIGGINLGVGGTMASQGLQKLSEFPLGKRQKVIVMFGLNDAHLGVPLSDYKANILKIVKKAGLKNTILMTSNPYHSDKGKNQELEPYIKAIRDIAKKHKIPLVDNYQAFAEIGTREPLENYYADPLHPNALGHQVIKSKLKSVLR